MFLAAVDCSPSSAFFYFMGITAAVVFSNLGASYGTARAGTGIASMGVMRPDLVMKNLLPVIFAGVLGIYGLIGGIVLMNAVKAPEKLSEYQAFQILAAGLTCGLSSLAAGLAIGIVGDAGVRAVAQQPRLFVGILLVLIFAEALGLYGLIVGIIMSNGKVPDNLCTAYGGVEL